MLAVRMVDVNVAFHQQSVLQHITIDFPYQGISVIVGRSGSGKTTLLRSINRLNETFVSCFTTGQIEANLGQGLESIFPCMSNLLTLPDLRRRVGMVFQTPNVFPVSVYRNIAVPLEQIAGISKKELPDHIESALDRVGLLEEVKDRLDIPAQHLSGGQQQRLCLARMLALEPAILLLDEPTASLDIQSSQKIELLLQELAQQYPIIMVSHNLSQVCRLAQHLIVLHQGRVTHTFFEKTYDNAFLLRMFDEEA